jgi:hypothetical protein
VCLTELNHHGGIDHFFICVDSEDDDYQTRFQEVETELKKFNPQTDTLTSQLDFGSNAFEGSDRWLEIAVQCSSDSGFGV